MQLEAMMMPAITLTIKMRTDMEYGEWNRETLKTVDTSHKEAEVLLK